MCRILITRCVLLEDLAVLLTSTLTIFLLTQKLLKQGYWYNKLLKTFSKGPVSIRPVSRPLCISFKLAVIKVACLNCNIMKCWIDR